MTDQNGGDSKPTFSDFISRLTSIILSNIVPIYGVLRLGWNSFSLVLLFILEGVLVLVIDIVKVQFASQKEKMKKNLLFEICFIFFFGFFAILVYGPYESLEDLLLDRMGRVGELVAAELCKPLLIIAFFRCVGLVQELLSAGATHARERQRLDLAGGRWSLLLFFAVMAAPIIAKAGPNPFAGLVALVLLKMAGEIIFAWLSRRK